MKRLFFILKGILNLRNKVVDLIVFWFNVVFKGDGWDLMNI